MTDLLPVEAPVELPVLLPDPRPSDPLEALSWLGETEEEVVKALRERGIKGIRNCPWVCPVARYLSIWWDDVSVWGEIAIMDIPFTADTPAHVFSFAKHFDGGRYPDLIDELDG